MSRGGKTSAVLVPLMLAAFDDALPSTFRALQQCLSPPLLVAFVAFYWSRCEAQAAILCSLVCLSSLTPCSCGIIFL